MLSIEADDVWALPDVHLTHRRSGCPELPSADHTRTLFDRWRCSECGQEWVLEFNPAQYGREWRRTVLQA